MFFAITDLLYNSLINNKNNIILNFLLIEYTRLCAQLFSQYISILFLIVINVVLILLLELDLVHFTDMW
jgi:hypothetical protein